MIDLLSQHLYSSPSVFIRELLQNAVDAITARLTIEPDYCGRIELELIRPAEGTPTLVVQDNGIGLTEVEIEQFLATIGGSSKRDSPMSRPTDFLGQFGIGLLACFLVADEIVVVTRSSRSEQLPGIEWRGRVDGTYATRLLTERPTTGTQVYLRAKPSATDSPLW
jgi:molecular chaperone HtpG